MKKILCTLLALTLSLATMSACTSTSQSSQAAATSSETSATSTASANKGPIGIVIPSADHGWMAGIAYYAQQECKELGLAEGTGYKLATSSNVNDQANQIDEMINLKCSAIVLLPQNDEVSVAAKKITDAKIPLIVFDRKVQGDYTAYFAGDNKAIGSKSADYIGEKLNGKGTVAVLNVPSSGSVSTERVNGFKDEIKAKYSDIKLVDMTAADFTEQSGLKTATDILVANKHLDAIYSIDDESSTGILEAIKEAHRTDVKLISGAGGEQAYFSKISSETQPECFTATYSPSMFKEAVKAAEDIAGGKTVAKDNIIPPTIVTKNNASKMMDTKSPY